MILFDCEQGTDKWKELRLAKITGIRLKDALVTKKNDDPALIYTLISEQMCGEIAEDFQSYAMKKGSELEPVAREFYANKTNQVVETFGFAAHDKYDWIGFSPDGFINEEKKLSYATYQKGLEIKCPNSNTHVRYLIENKVPDCYWHQMLMSFIVNEKQESHDFISFDPLNKYKPMFVKTTYKEDLEKDIAEALDKLLHFRSKWLTIYNKIIF